MTAAVKANWTYPTKIWFGPGRLSDVADACRVLHLNNQLIVIDGVLAGLASGTLLRSALTGANREPVFFTDFKSNPTDEDLAKGLDAYRAGGHDGVVAVGGGSALDIGKSIAFMSAQSRPIWDFEDVGDWWTRANADGIPPVVAIPTTAGTGSEVGRAVVISRASTHEKKIIFHPSMMPAITIVDPQLAMTLPKYMTIGTAFDALAHCIEALCVPSFHTLADAIAIDGARLIMANLETAVTSPHDLAARTALAMGSIHGGTAFQKGLGAVHALSHPIGARFSTHHGMTNAVLQPYVLVHNRAAIDDKISRVAGACGLAPNFDAFLDAVLELRTKVGVPHTLPLLDGHIVIDDDLLTAALADPTAAGNPIALDAARVRDIGHAAMLGVLDRR